jgi:hypothetical protein
VRDISASRTLRTLRKGRVGQGTEFFIRLPIDGKAAARISDGA